MRYFAHPTRAPGPYRIVVTEHPESRLSPAGVRSTDETPREAVWRLRGSLFAEIHDLERKILACDEKLAELEGGS